MIKKVRVDYRLLHGQVAFSWTSKLSADCILLVTDTLQDDPVRVTSVKLAKPPGVKVVVKTIEESIKAVKSGITDKYHLFVVCENIEGAYRLVKELGIKELNLGGTTPGDDKKCLAPVVYVNQEEEEMLRELIEDGVHVYQQGVPEKAEQKIHL
ncbi:PTS sugar transporter subunit IIB [Anaerostipes sp.]|uniref:PTS sugar transporter subunit IIB n=1 Tax=Anaerostipes sp. TaxID=1872530 RepID=UPI0025C22F0B|nr:PTS sugar transporter subunit IIB [Anaerostipes sp.]MBS7009128.1 PTS sugar transporter subunit IIB [Anaerostipes sp.]